VTGHPQHGEVWWCELPDVGRRPVVVLSRGEAVRSRRRAVVAPCTTNVRGLPSEVRLEPGEDPVPRPCVASLDSLESVPTGVLVQRLGLLDPERMRSICTALGVAVDCR
jgi:mRNA interferase MazF